MNAAPDAQLNLTTLQRLPYAELVGLAAARGLPLRPQQAGDTLVAMLLQHELETRGTTCAEGVLDLLPEGYGFLRSPWRDFLASADDVFVSPSLVRSLNLRQGHRLAGPLRGPRGNEKFFALEAITTVNDLDAAALASRPPFASRMPIVAQRPLRLPPATPALRALGRLAPWCHGHRALVVTPPGWPRAAWMASLAAAVRAADAAPWLCVCLLDQRPEAAAAARAQLAALPRCEVVATTFDEPPVRALAVAELTLARALREVEAGADVVLLFDSLTALAQAAHVVQPATGRWLCPGLDAAALGPGKRLFAAARALAEGGSLTVIAAADHAAGNSIDEAVLQGFRDRGNSEVVVAADADPAMPFDVLATRTRPEDVGGGGLAADERRRLAALDAGQRARAFADDPDPAAMATTPPDQRRRSPGG